MSDNVHDFLNQLRTNANGDSVPYHLVQECIAALEAQQAEIERLRSESAAFRNALIRAEQAYQAERSLADQLAEACSDLFEKMPGEQLPRIRPSSRTATANYRKARRG